MNNKDKCEIKTYTPFLRVKHTKNKRYLYEITQSYDPVTKKIKQKSKYIRKIEPDEDLDNLTREPPEKDLLPKLKHIVDFGDAYLFQSLVNELHLEKIIKKCFPEETANLVLLLAGYRLLSGKAFSHMSSWSETTDLLSYYPISFSLSSQNISRYLEQIGCDDSDAISHFFLHWTQIANKNGQSLLFDLTSFSSSSEASSIEELEYGYSKDSNPDPQINMGLLVNQSERLPMYYKLYPGSIKDVTTLTNIIEELKIFKIPDITLILDRGFYSELNLKRLHKENISFILPLSMVHKTLYNALLEKHESEIGSIHNIILIDGKLVSVSNGMINYPEIKPEPEPETKIEIKKKEINKNIYKESFTLYYVIYQDSDRFQKEENAFLTDFLLAEEKLKQIDWDQFGSDTERQKHWNENIDKWSDCFSLIFNKETNKYQVIRNSEKMNKLKHRLGIMILLSSEEISPVKLLPLYRERDTVEKLFDCCKNELAGLPLRVHKGNTMKGFFFILFISMIVQFHLLDKMKKGKVDPKFSISEIFFEMHKLKKAIWLGKKKLINEVTKTQRIILEQLKIFMPTFEGN